MRFSQREKKDLWFAGFMISLAFAILLGGGLRTFTELNTTLLTTFIIAFFTAGLGFLLHEIMHKYIAQSYNLRAEFRAFPKMLWLALLFSLFGFIIAAPGAVFIRGFNISREKNGKISFAGPATNIVLSFLFLIPLLLIQETGFLHSLFGFGLRINSLLAAFNMIPVMPFDGSKIIAWNKGIYTITVIIAVGLFIFSFFV